MQQEDNDHEVVIIPTFNESENIAELVHRLRSAGYKDKILVVDDSPTDETAKAARDVGCEVFWRRGKGLSSAVIDGIKATTSHKIVVMDADLQHPPELVPKILNELDTHDFVVASRYIKDGGCKEWDLDRKIISRAANLATRPLTGRAGVKDAVSGFFGFKRNGLPHLNGVNDKGFKIMLELLVKGNWGSVVEVPYTFGVRTRGKTKMRWEQVRDYLMQLASLYLYKFRVLRFGAVGGLGVLTSLLILFLLTSGLNIHYLISFVFAFIVAATQNYWLNKKWTFSDRHEAKLGYARYLLAASATLVIDEALLFAFTDLLGVFYMISAVMAIAIAFIVRYVWVSRWIWKKQSTSP